MNHSVSWSPGMRLEALEQECILLAYSFYGKNKTATANSLGISIRTLDNKLEKYLETAAEQEKAGELRRIEREEQLRRARGVGAQPSQHYTQTSSYTETYGDKTGAGLHAQSAAQVSAQQQVSMSERSEVQEVLPKSAAGGGAPRRR